MKNMLVWYVLLFVVIGGIVFFASGQEPGALLGVAVAAVIGFAIMAAQMRSQWSGTIEDLVEKKVDVSSGDESNHYQTRLFAVVRLENGRTKKVQADPNWKIGDRLVKQRGATGIQVNSEA